VGKGGHGSGRGGAGIGLFPTRPAPCGFGFFQPATRAKITISAHVWGLRSGAERGGSMRVGWVGLFSSIIVSSAHRTNKPKLKLHNPTGNIKRFKPINNEKKKKKRFRSIHERGIEREKYLDLWRWERCSNPSSEEVEWRRKQQPVV
jgi:hypothetical protein